MPEMFGRQVPRWVIPAGASALVLILLLVLLFTGVFGGGGEEETGERVSAAERALTPAPTTTASPTEAPSIGVRGGSGQGQGTAPPVATASAQPQTDPEGEAATPPPDAPTPTPAPTPEATPEPETQYVTIVGSATVANGSFNAHRVNCPAGMVATGGGIDPENVFTMTVTSSGPVFGDDRLVQKADGPQWAPTGWQASAKNNSGSTKTIKVAVVCTDLQGVSSVVGSASIPNGSFNTALVTCPAQTVAIGGGADLWNVLTMNLTSSGPSYAGDTRLLNVSNGQNAAATGWYGGARNDSGGAAPMRIAAICAPIAGVVTVVGSSDVSPDNFGGGRVQCPADTIALGGGSDNFNVFNMHVTSSGPSFGAGNTDGLIWQNDGQRSAPTGWEAYSRNNVPPDATTRYVKFAVICV